MKKTTIAGRLLIWMSSLVPQRDDQSLAVSFGDPGIGARDSLYWPHASSSFALYGMVLSQAWGVLNVALLLGTRAGQRIRTAIVIEEHDPFCWVWKPTLQAGVAMEAAMDNFFAPGQWIPQRTMHPGAQALRRQRAALVRYISGVVV
jgi:hypothetical protein